MDSKFWTAFFGGVLLHASVIHMILGNLPFVIVLGALGMLQIYLYGKLNEKEDDHGNN